MEDTINSQKQKPEVFLSYPHYDLEDSKKCIDNLHRRLEDKLRDICVFEDKHDIYDKASFVDELELHLRKDMLLLSIVNYHYFVRPWCCYELLVFCCKQKTLNCTTIIIPVLFEDIKAFSIAICKQQDNCPFEEIVKNLSAGNNKNLSTGNDKCPIIEVYTQYPDFNEERVFDTICAKLYHTIIDNDYKTFENHVWLETLYARYENPPEEAITIKANVDNLVHLIRYKYLQLKYCPRGC